MHDEYNQESTKLILEVALNCLEDVQKPIAWNEYTLGEFSDECIELTLKFADLKKRMEARMYEVEDELADMRGTTMEDYL